MPADMRAATAGGVFLDRCPLCSGAVEPFGVARVRYVTLHATQWRCTACGVLLSNPQASEATRAAYYQATYYQDHWPDAERLWAANVEGYSAHDFALLQQVGQSRVPRAGRALDVGCGYGAMVAVLERNGFRAMGCDLSPRACAFASSQRLNVVCAATPGLPFAQASFDLVISSHVIEHVTNPMAFVRELVSLVVPGGCVALVTDHLRSAQSWWDRVRSLAAGRVPPFHTSTDHTFVLSPSHVRRALEDAGCVDVEIVAYHHAPAIERLHWRAYKSAFRTVDRLLGWGLYQLAVARRAQ